MDRDRAIVDQEGTPLLSVGPVRPRDRKPRNLGLDDWGRAIDCDTGEEVPEKEIEEEGAR